MQKIAITCGFLAAGMSYALAQDLAAQTAALKVIRETAADICYTVDQQGSQNEAQLAGDAQAKLNGAISKIVELGVKGSGQLRNQEYQGVLREELASAIKNSTDCRRDVFNKLLEKMLPSLGNPSETHSKGPDRITLTPSALPSRDWQFKVSPTDENDYFLRVDGVISFQTKGFNQPSYLRGLDQVSIVRIPGNTSNLGANATPDCSPFTNPCSPDNPRTESELGVDAVHFKLFLKLKKKPRDSDEFEFRTGARRWAVRFGALDWTELRGFQGLEKPVWWGAGAKLELVAEDPDWVVLHSGRLLSAKPEPQDTQVALLEVTIENRSPAPAPIDGLNLAAFQPGPLCLGPGPAPPPIPVRIDWPRIVQLTKLRSPGNEVLVTMADTVVSEPAIFQPAGCGNDAVFRTHIPIQVTVPPLEMERITLRINEVTIKPSANDLARYGVTRQQWYLMHVPATLREWKELIVAVESDAPVFPHQYAIRETSLAQTARELH